MTAVEIRTEEDGQHQVLAPGAVEQAMRALAEDAVPNEFRLADVVEEAGLAWLNTGLLPSALPKYEQDEICAAIAGRVATVLVMVGWRPPVRLLSEEQAATLAAEAAARPNPEPKAWEQLPLFDIPQKEES